MKRKRHIEAQIFEKLRFAERLAAEGQSGATIARQLEVSEQAYYRQKKEYAGTTKQQMQRLRELQRENERLKKLVANKELDLMMLKDVLSKKF